MSMILNFTKMQGLGNDYVYVDCSKKSPAEIKAIASLAHRISNRHFGIGSDGLILICESQVADFKMIMYNSDGTQAEICGNGIRCVGKFVFDKKLTQKKNIKIETLAGVKELTLFEDRKGQIQEVRVNMGVPIFEADKIPVISKSKIVNNLLLTAEDKKFNFTCLSMGNPHAVTFINNLDDFDIEKYGKPLEKDSHFPQKANIEFVEIIDETTLKMRVWERGSGETLACGTGASAVCVAATINGYCPQNEIITIKLLGGDLKIKWDNEVFMTGPATTVFEGEIQL